MREIKFRAWDELDKKMSFWTLNDLIINFGYSELTEKPNVLNDEFMQYTGLKDKNGVEIYEGDIVKWSNKTYKVVWYEKIAGFVMEYNGIERPDIEFECEIIGNIYENPELLT